MNCGWYTVYLLMIVLNSVMVAAHGFGVTDWQSWAWLAMMILCFISGDNYRK